MYLSIHVMYFNNLDISIRFRYNCKCLQFSTHLLHGSTVLFISYVFSLKFCKIWPIKPTCYTILFSLLSLKVLYITYVVPDSLYDIQNLKISTSTESVLFTIIRLSCGWVSYLPTSTYTCKTAHCYSTDG